MRMTHFEKEDVLHLMISEGNEVDSVELMPNITAELDDQGELIGVEILSASTFMRDFMLDSLQAKLANLRAPS